MPCDKGSMTGQPVGIPVPLPVKRPSHVTSAGWFVPVQLRAVRRAVEVPPAGTDVGVKARCETTMVPVQWAGRLATGAGVAAMFS